MCHHHRRSVISIWFLVAAAGCPDRTIAKLDPQQQGEVTKRIPVSANIDLLFVIDNSASTQDKQTVFAQNFTSFVSKLQGFPGGLPNLHMGVVSSTVKIGSQDVTDFTNPCVNAPGDDGLLHVTPNGSCTAPSDAANDRFIVDVAASGGTRTTNYDPAQGLAATFACIAQIGSEGCGFEAPLEGMKRALDGTNPGNAGFIRDDAFLAVIILTDEDDASVADPSVFALPTSQVGTEDFRLQPLYAYQCDQPITAAPPGANYTDCVPVVGSYLQDTAYYTSFLASIKDPSQLVVALIAGGQQDGSPPSSSIATGPLMIGTASQPMALQPSCNAMINGENAIARPAIRLFDFVSQFSDHGLYQTICTGDYTPALTAIGDLLATAISPCLEGAIDTTDGDPNNPGTQLQCTVSEVAGDGSETVLAPCAMQDAMTPAAGTATPCWYVVEDDAQCSSTQSHLTLKTDPEQMTLPPDSSTVVSCATLPQGS